ncbi:MAG: restriction endonuclease subunit S [Chloroflexi bacterium]|nr:restriction endonuclease subunit S [Chloroflexota bacterium]
MIDNLSVLFNPRKSSPPDGWKIVRIGDHAKLVAGGTPSTRVQEYWDNGNVLWMRSGDVHKKRIFDVEGRITKKGLDNSSATFLPIDSILVALAGQGKTRGTVAVNKVELSTNQSVAAIIPKIGLDHEFLYYNLDARYELLRKLSTGDGGRGGLNLKILRNIWCVLPPLPEQRKIAGILSTWDEVIAKTAQLIAALQERKKGLMQHLLTGAVRFPGYVQSDEMQETKFGDIPVDWNTARIEQVAETLFSNVDKKTDPDEVPVRLCNYMDVFKNLFIINDLQFMEASANQREIDKFTLLKDDVIITKDSEVAEEIAEATVVSEELRNVICGYHLAILRPKRKVFDGTFLMYLLHYPPVQNQFARLANGITRFGLTIDSVNHALVVFPSLPEQKKIASVLKSCDKEMTLFQLKLGMFQQQKKDLMQRLLTGEIRVKPERFPSKS